MDDGPAFLKEGKDLSGIQNVRRPPAPYLDPAKDDLIFMQIDTDYYTAVPPGKLPLTNILVYIANIKNYNGQETPVIRMFGITKLSNSVAIHVHNFTPYFYVKVDTSRHTLSPDDL